MSYKVLYHAGDEVDIKTKARSGRLVLGDCELRIESADPVCVLIETIRSVRLFRMHGLGRMLQVDHESGRLFVSVIRFSIADYFAVVDFFGTGRLRSELERATAHLTNAST